MTRRSPAPLPHLARLHTSHPPVSTPAQYCFYYHEYCQYCFYYNDYTWLHRLWSTGVTELTPGGQPIGNQFGGSISTS